MSFCCRLVHLRRSQGLTQAELAEIICISRSSLSGIESGRRDPSIDTLIRLADFFEVSVDYLLNRSDTPSVQTDIFAKRSPEEMLSLFSLMIKVHKKQQ